MPDSFLHATLQAAALRIQAAIGSVAERLADALAQLAQPSVNMSCAISALTRRFSQPVSRPSWLRQNSPWCTSSASAPAAAAASIRARLAVTPLTSLRTCALPSTWRPFGP